FESSTSGHRRTSFIRSRKNAIEKGFGAKRAPIAALQYTLGLPKHGGNEPSALRSRFDRGTGRCRVETSLSQISPMQRKSADLAFIHDGQRRSGERAS